MKFIVTVKEVWEQCYEVEADSENTAIEKVRDGDGNILENTFEYVDTLNTDKWKVERVN